jgi:decaprenylphospho-beta-D-ribofuranose 2-oxidase
VALTAAGAPPAATSRLTSGWGRTAPVRADVVTPRDAAEVAGAPASAGTRGALPRGLGRAYGDAAQNAGGTLLDLSRLDAISDFDAERGAVTAGAGVSLDRLMRVTLQRGWFVPVTPGTRFVSLGGAIACDIHGKNHHRDGSISRHAEWLELVAPGAGPRRITSADDAFAATAGGMGLTGVVTAARLRLLPVRTSAIRVTTERACDLADLMDRLSAGDDDYRYSVAWIDCLARGRSLGRGVITRGDHAEPDELPARDRAAPLAFDPRRAVAAPRLVPPGLLNQGSMRLFNAAWFRRAPTYARTIEPLARFFHPLDAVRDWNRLYGPRGLIQYQAVLPFGREDALVELVERLSSAGLGSFLAVLKRFGAEAPLLSFPRPGWTLAVDFPAASERAGPVLDQLDELVAASGGRVYLAKDARLRPELLGAMYHELARWQEIRDRLDPQRVMVSDLARRLGIAGDPP